MWAPPRGSIVGWFWAGGPGQYGSLFCGRGCVFVQVAAGVGALCRGLADRLSRSGKVVVLGDREREEDWVLGWIGG